MSRIQLSSALYVRKNPGKSLHGQHTCSGTSSRHVLVLRAPKGSSAGRVTATTAPCRHDCAASDQVSVRGGAGRGVCRLRKWCLHYTGGGGGGGGGSSRSTGRRRRHRKPTPSTSLSRAQLPTLPPSPPRHARPHLPFPVCLPPLPHPPHPPLPPPSRSRCPMKREDTESPRHTPPLTSRSRCASSSLSSRSLFSLALRTNSSARARASSALRAFLEEP